MLKNKWWYLAIFIWVWGICGTTIDFVPTYPVVVSGIPTTSQFNKLN